MFEVVIFCLLVLAIAAYCFPVAVKSLQQWTAESTRLKIQREIEGSLFPRPSDSVLRRHYDALVAAEVENRLARTK